MKLVRTLLSILLFIALISCGQTDPNTPYDESKERWLPDPEGYSKDSFMLTENIIDTSLAYTRAIEEYLKATTKDDPKGFDTLFIGNPDLLPELNLPEFIAGKRIVLNTPDIAVTRPEKNKNYVLVNIGWAAFEKDPVEFMFVTFHQGDKPQHHCLVYLKYDPAEKNYAFARTAFEYPYKEKK